MSEVTDTSVVLEWRVPEDDGGCEISSYIIEYNRVRLRITPDGLHLIQMLSFLCRLVGICG